MSVRPRPAASSTTRDIAAADVVEMANQRCNQERTIGELKGEGSRHQMRFRTFVQTMMTMPAQVLRVARQLVVRLLDWSPCCHVFFRALDAVRTTT